MIPKMLYLSSLLFGFLTTKTSASPLSAILKSVATMSSVPPGPESQPSKIVKVRFYGESECPFCDRFVFHTLPQFITDNEIMQYVDFDAIEFGNSYFASKECGDGSSGWSGKEAECWIGKCLKSEGPSPNLNVHREENLGSSSESTSKLTDSSNLYFLQSLSSTTVSPYSKSGTFAPPDWCFESSTVLSQHGPVERLFNLYESCAEQIQPTSPAPPIPGKLPHWSANSYVFDWCADGELAQGKRLLPDQILEKCAHSAGFDPADLKKCAEDKKLSHAIEVRNGQRTPQHRGVPYVLIDGKMVDNPSKTRGAICKVLEEKLGKKGMPRECNDEPNVKVDYDVELSTYVGRESANENLGRNVGGEKDVMVV